MEEQRWAQVIGEKLGEACNLDQLLREDFLMEGARELNFSSRRNSICKDKEVRRCLEYKQLRVAQKWWLVRKERARGRARGPLTRS